MPENSNLNTPADRLLYLRHRVARLTRKEVAEKYDIPAVTLKTWESGTVPLTKKAVARCIAFFLKENIVVTEEWLLKGVGSDPKFSLNMNRYLAQESDEEPASTVQECVEYYVVKQLVDNDSILQDVRYFKTQYKDSVVFLVPGDEMLPLYSAGDYVGGRDHRGEELMDVVNQICIVTLEDGRVLLRHVYFDGSHYNLSCSNPQIKIAQPVLYEVNIISAAPVLWHRRASPIQPASDK